VKWSDAGWGDKRRTGTGEAVTKWKKWGSGAEGKKNRKKKLKIESRQLQRTKKWK